MLVARFNPNGTLDGTFGAGGFKLAQPVNQYSSAHALTIQADGTIIVAGTPTLTTTVSTRSWPVLGAPVTPPRLPPRRTPRRTPR